MKAGRHSSRRDTDRALRTVAYIFTVLFILMILTPLFYVVSLSFQDDNAIYDVPPHFIPPSGESVSVVVDYSGMSADTPDQLKDAMLRDSTVALYSIIYQQNKDTISEIRFYGVENNRTVFYSRGQGVQLKLLMQIGVYAHVMVSQRTLLNSGRYLKSADILGYRFDLNGLPSSYTAPQTGGSHYETDISGYLPSQYPLQGTFVGTHAKPTYILEMLENYIYYFKFPQYAFPTVPSIAQYSFFAFLSNTLITVVTVIVSQVILCALTAYPLSKLLGKRASQIMLMFFLVTMMIPFASIMIPQLTMVKDWGLYNTLGGMLVTWLNPGPFFIFLYKGFFDQVPSEYMEASRIDGAGDFRIFLQILMPMSKPVIVMITLYSFIGGWADFFWYFLIANTPRLWTLNVAIYQLSQLNTAKQNFLMGLSALTIVPVLILAAVFSKQIKSSVMSTGLKG